MSIRVVLLLAGRGARLRPLTDARPKCLTDMLDRNPLDINYATMLVYWGESSRGGQNAAGAAQARRAVGIWPLRKRPMVRTWKTRWCGKMRGWNIENPADAVEGARKKEFFFCRNKAKKLFDYNNI